LLSLSPSFEDALRLKRKFHLATSRDILSSITKAIGIASKKSIVMPAKAGIQKRSANGLPLSRE
jgi:hypothetical protein